MGGLFLLALTSALHYDSSMKKHGFSLVELSIVLVILGLLTGGILAGQSLIRAAELRSVSADMQRYNAAYYSFRDKYLGLPGDLANATAFWTSAGGTGANVACVEAQTSSSSATCNGNGDGNITSGISGYTYAERFMAWKHLASAGLIEGSYTGRSNGAATTYDAVIGTNVPASRLSSGYWDIYYATSSSTNHFIGPAANTFRLFDALLKPEEAWNIDTKQDDGSPVYGKVVVYRPSAASFVNTCATPDNNTANYNLIDTSKQCVMNFILR